MQAISIYMYIETKHKTKPDSFRPYRYHVHVPPEMSADGGQVMAGLLEEQDRPLVISPGQG